jgi:hypothetical protein
MLRAMVKYNILNALDREVVTMYKYINNLVWYCLKGELPR